jgi:hypothetical protein
MDPSRSAAGGTGEAPLRFGLKRYDVYRANRGPRGWVGVREWRLSDFIRAQGLSRLEPLLWSS